MSWGYFPEGCSVAKIEDLLSASGGTDVTTKVRFTAALTSDFASSEEYGLMHGTIGFFVFVDESLDSFVSKEPRTRPNVMLAHLKEVGRGAYYAASQQPIDTPSYCPKARSPGARAAFGRVEVARGAQDAGGTTWCLYRNENDFSNFAM